MRKVFSSIECTGYQLVEYRLALRIPSHDRLLSSFPASTRKSLLNLHQKPNDRPQSWNFRRLSKGGRRNEEKAVPSTKSRQARKAY